MGFGAAIRSSFRNYFRLSGRASRAEYWWVVLFLFLLGVVAVGIDFAVFGPGMLDSDAGGAVALVVMLQLVWLVRPSEPGANAYGPNPCGEGA